MEAKIAFEKTVYLPRETADIVEADNFKTERLLLNPTDHIDSNQRPRRTSQFFTCRKLLCLVLLNLMRLTALNSAFVRTRFPYPILIHYAGGSRD